MTDQGTAARDLPRTAYLRVGETGRKVSHTIDYGGGLLVDVDSDGYAVGVELIGETEPAVAFWRIATETRLSAGRPVAHTEKGERR